MVSTPSENGLRGNSRGDVMFGPHLVALMDFVGQSRKLMEWDYSPNAQTLHHFLQAAKATFGSIRTWREQFEKQFRQFVDRRINTIAGVVDGLPDKGSRLRRFQATSLGFSHFSDTIIVYYPVVNQNGLENVANATGALVICGVLLLASLADRKSVFRGGIDIGMAARFPQADIYGPALAKAHHLESKLAQYPRILVGEQLRECLRKHAESQPSSPEEEANRDIAQMSIPCFAQDDDGEWIVDYLGKGFVEITGAPAALRNLYQPAWDFVRQERERFRREQNKCLAGRYERLCRYFESRLGSAQASAESQS